MTGEGNVIQAIDLFNKRVTTERGVFKGPKHGEKDRLDIIVYITLPEA